MFKIGDKIICKKSYIITKCYYISGKIAKYELIPYIKRNVHYNTEYIIIHKLDA